MIRYIYDRTGYFDLFGSRIVNKLTVPTRRTQDYSKEPCI